jgi:hypothetical protein
MIFDFRNSSAFVPEYGSEGVRASAEFRVNVLTEWQIESLRKVGTGLGQGGENEITKRTV